MRRRSRSRWVLILLAAAAAALAVGASAYPRLRAVIGVRVRAHGGKDSCRVRRGEAEADVRARCGEPCARGGVPKAGDCPGMPSQGLVTLCSWDCDIYGDEAVCYLGSAVVDVVAREAVVPFGPCGWGER